MPPEIRGRRPHSAQRGRQAATPNWVTHQLTAPGTPGAGGAPAHIYSPSARAAAGAREPHGLLHGLDGEAAAGGGPAGHLAPRAAHSLAAFGDGPLPGAVAPLSPAPSPAPVARIAKPFPRGAHAGLAPSGLGAAAAAAAAAEALSPVDFGGFDPAAAPLASTSAALAAVSRIYDELDDGARIALLRELLAASSRDVLVATQQTIEPRLSHDPFEYLPTEVSLRVLSFLSDPKSLAAAAQVSRRWYLLLSDDCTWKQLCATHHYRRLSAAGSAHPRNIYVGMDEEESSVAVSLGNLSEMIFDPRAAERPVPTSYRSHFRQQHLLNAAWASGGRVAARYVMQYTDNIIVTTFIMEGDYMAMALDNARILVFALNGRLLSSLFGHVMGVWALAMHGHTLVSGGCDRDVRVWDLRTGLCTRILKGHESTVRCLAMAGPHTVVSGSRDSTVRVWDLRTGKCRFELDAHSLTVRRLWADARLCISASYDCTARVWDLETGELLHTLQGHLGQIYSLAVEGTTVVTGSTDQTIRVWDLSTGACRAVLQGHLALVGQLALRGNTLVSGASDSAVRVWDLTTMQCVHRIAAHDNSVTCLQFDGERIVTGSPDGHINIWDAATGKHVRTLGVPLTNVWGLAAREDRLAFVGAQGTKTIVELLSFVPDERGHDGEVAAAPAVPEHALMEVE